MKKYHYTYLLIGVDHRLYIGKRSCDCLPEKDNYWGNYRDKTFKPKSKHIQEIFSTKEEALAHEIKLHNEFDVAKNSLFVNKARQTSIGFDTTGAKLTAEHKVKIGAASRGRACTPEARIKLSVAHKGKIRTKEHRANISAAAKVYTWRHLTSLEEVRCSVRELAERYGLVKDSLHKVAQGTRSRCRNWTIVVL